MTMTLKTCAVVGAAIIAELLFCALFLASLSMASARWTTPGTPATHTADSGQRSTEPGTPSEADPVAVATPSPGLIPCQSPGMGPGPRSQTSRTDVVEKIAAMRDMHDRISGAISGATSEGAGPEAVASLLPGMDRLMHEGLILMRAMKPGLPATETGEVVQTELTAEQAESVLDFLDLMEALIVIKGDRDSVMNGSFGNGLGRASPRTHEGPTAIGEAQFRFRTLVRPHRGELNGFGMSI